MEKFKSRRYRDSDYDRYFEINEDCFRPYVEKYYSIWDEKDQHIRLKERIEERKKHGVFETVLCDDSIVGFTCYTERSDKIEITLIMLDAAHRGGGYGSAYIDRVLNIAKRKDKPVFLQVFKSNPASKLYERFGFERYNESESHYQYRCFTPRIETPRLILRNYKLSDLNDYFAYISQPNIGPRTGGWPPYKSKAKAKERLKLEIDKPLQFAIELKAEHKVIGSIELMPFNKKNYSYITDKTFLKTKANKMREVGYLLNEDYWNSGYMTEAIKGVLDFAFNELKLKAVHGGYYEPNAASGRVQEKNGFEYIGREKDHIKWYLTDEYVDLVILGITAKRYKKLNSK